MTTKDFQKIMNEQFTRCKDLLTKKAIYYHVHEDRLEQFKKAGILQHETSMKALGGMMAKHTTKLYDMIEYDLQLRSTEDIEEWNEIITDHINFLLLLRALVEEDE